MFLMIREKIKYISKVWIDFMVFYDVIILKEGNCKNLLDIYYIKFWFEIDVLISI